MSAICETPRKPDKVLGDLLCCTYSPLDSQAHFQAFRGRFKGFSGPVGSGKSAALCFEVIRQCYWNRDRQGVLAAPTFAMLRDATLTSLLQMIEEQDIDFDFRKADGELTLKAPHSTIRLRSLDEPERLRGTNLAWFGIDELSYTREDAWMRLEARLRDPKAARLCGFGVWTPQGNDWIYRRFIHKPVSGYESVRAKPFENRFLLEKTPDYYKRLESSYDPKFYQQEVLGEYVNSRADRVYYCFNAAVHLVQQAYDPHKILMWALDFNVAPMTSLLLQRDHGRLVVIDEIVLDRATTEEACQEFENRYKGHAAGLDIFGDVSGRNMHTTGTSDYIMLKAFLYKGGFRNVRLRIPSSNPPVLDRVHKVNGLLTNVYGEVRLEINRKCKELIKDFEEVMFKPESGVIDKAKDPKRTHASDALGYVVWQLFGPKASAGEMEKPLF